MDKIINISVNELYNIAVRCRTESDYDNYFIYMTMAANMNYQPAIVLLHDDYVNGTNNKQNHSITYSFYSTTAMYPYSLNYLAYMYYHGIEVGKDPHQNAPHFVGDALANGAKGTIARDPYKSFTLFKQNVEQNQNAFSMHNLALMYESGTGCQQNFEKAIELYLKAIDRGHVQSIGNLGQIYELVLRDYQKAITLYQTVIKKGYLRSSDVCTRVLESLCNLYKTDIEKYKINAIEFLLSIGKVAEIQKLYQYDDFVIGILKINYILEKENSELRTENSLLRGH